MATIQEDSNSDSHLDQEVLDEDFERPPVAAPRSYEDLTEKKASASRERALLFHLHRQPRHIDTRETQC